MAEGRPPCVMFIGAHCDDIEIGCGGTVLELVHACPQAQIHWVVLSTGAGREREARRAAKALLKGAEDVHVDIQQFRGSYFPSEWVAIKEYFEVLKARAKPDIVFCHAREELHQDHRIAGELAWNTWRNHLILEYEIPKYDGGLGSPQAFVSLRKSSVSKKVKVLMSTFQTQLDKQWFTPSTFEGLMRLRGIECNSASGYAEAFYCRKLVLGMPR